MLDDFNREGLGIEVDFSLPAVRVVRSLNQIIEWRGKPQAFVSTTAQNMSVELLMEWAEKRKAFGLNTSSPESRSRTPILSGTIARFAANGWSQYIFETIEEAQDQATEWLWTYNNDDPTWPSAASHPL